MVTIDKNPTPIIVDPVKGMKRYDFGYKCIPYKDLIEDYARALASFDTNRIQFLEELRPKLKDLRSLTKSSLLDIDFTRPKLKNQVDF